MKKIKKVLAMIMAMAMIMGLGMTAFAAQVTSITSNIYVQNLAAGQTTQVTLLNAIYYDKTTDSNGVETQSWVVADWAESYIKEANGKYTILDESGLKTAAETAAMDEENIYATETTEAGETSVTFENVPIGAYVVLASDGKNVYNLMVAQTYKDGEAYITPTNATVIAKPDTYKNTKSDNADLVHRGQEVTFTATSFVPAKSVVKGSAEEKLSRFTITDTPIGLQITDIESITIGNTVIYNGVPETDLVEVQTVTEGTEPSWSGEKDGTALITNLSNGLTENMVIDLFNIVKKDEYLAGSTITVVYKATVMDEESYNNTVASDSNTVDYEPATEDGFEASIQIFKVDTAGERLSGAEFQVSTLDGTKLNFVKMDNGVYKLALESESGDPTVAVDSNGSLRLKGLAAGTYTLTETKAPDGYSGGAVKTVEIGLAAGGDSAEDIVYTYGENTQNIVNTKLSALPSTGGIGTTIFTIGGIVIMIGAAALYFANRKKNSAE